MDTTEQAQARAMTLALLSARKEGLWPVLLWSFFF